MQTIVLIGQSLPARVDTLPFTTTRLYAWLSEIGMSQEDALKRFLFKPLINIYPGKGKYGDIPPSKEQIRSSRPELIKFLKKHKVDVVVPIGIYSIREAISDSNIKLVDVIGKRLFQDPFNMLGKKMPIIPLPHPSGASPWVHMNDNKQLLADALQLLACEINK